MTALDLSLSDEQRMLQHSVQRFLADQDRPLWRDLSEALSLGGVALPEAVGGFGGGMADIAVVMAELGPALAGADWLSHAVGAMLLARVAPDHPVLADLATGMRRIAILCSASTSSMPVVGDGPTVRGRAELAVGGAEADMFLIADCGAMLLLSANPGKIEQRHRIMHDGSVSADLVFTTKAGDTVALVTGPEAGLLADYANDVVLVGRCAEAVGLIRHMIADSVDYLGQRKQFGMPLGTFQALRHRAADMQLAAMKAAALVEVAILAIDQDRPDRTQAVSAACIEIADAVRIVGESAVQIHGAMGLTEELSLGGHFKRALAIVAAFGPRAGHLARFAEAAA